MGDLSAPAPMTRPNTTNSTAGMLDNKRDSDDRENRSKTTSNASIEMEALDGATINGAQDSDLEKAQGKEKGDVIDEEEDGERDPNVVTWDGPNDPQNPMNWTMKKKWMNIAVLSILTLVT